ncbi:hypothetical protein [Methylobacterium sp. 2A]|uniref:hypothetical protein n=1 Tax=Methylobacterium sp. 2A TaxID=2603816 RepID=UPI001FED2FD9|nr:hypothetical protein [Methylobacterium sp. 2A]
MPATVDGLLTVSAREAQAAHRGTDAILTMMRQGGGEPDPDDPAAAIAEMLMQAEERDAAMADAITAMRGILDELSDIATKIRAEQAQAAAREQQLHQATQAQTQRLEQFLSMVRILPSANPGAGGPH